MSHHPQSSRLNWPFIFGNIVPTRRQLRGTCTSKVAGLRSHDLLGTETRARTRAQDGRYRGMPSSVISSFDYEPEECLLTILFRNGRIYVYYDVPADVADDFGNAPSKGSFFNTFIRDHYHYREVVQ
jgi:hypothetical protein